MIFVQLIPGIALAIGGLMMGESPRWLVQKKRQQEALKVLTKVRGADDNVKLEIAQICNEDAAIFPLVAFAGSCLVLFAVLFLNGTWYILNAVIPGAGGVDVAEFAHPLWRGAWRDLG